MEDYVWANKIVQLLEENIGVNICDLVSGNSFLDMTSKVQMTEEKKKKEIGLNQNLKPLCFKCQENGGKKKDRHRLVENIGKPCICWGSSIHNI